MGVKPFKELTRASVFLLIAAAIVSRWSELLGIALACAAFGSAATALLIDFVYEKREHVHSVVEFSRQAEGGILFPASRMRLRAVAINQPSYAERPGELENFWKAGMHEAVGGIIQEKVKRPETVTRVGSLTAWITSPDYPQSLVKSIPNAR